MGGGKKSFIGNTTTSVKDDGDKHMCVRTDGRNLINEWIKDKQSRQLSFQYLADENDINSLDVEHTEYILGRYIYIYI